MHQDVLSGSRVCEGGAFGWAVLDTPPVPLQISYLEYVLLANTCNCP